MAHQGAKAKGGNEFRGSARKAQGPALRGGAQAAAIAEGLDSDVEAPVEGDLAFEAEGDRLTDRDLVEDAVLELTGVTRKGKNRVREHGTTWVVTLVSDAVQALGGAPGALIHPVGKKVQLRWIEMDGGPDFELKE